MSLAAHIARIEALGELPRRAGPRVALAVEREQRAQIARGVDPSGKPWPLTKSGEKPLQNAASAVSVAYVSGAVVIAVEGPEDLHNRGKARGHVLRRIIPSGPLPAPLSRVISDTIDAERARIMAGAR